MQSQYYAETLIMTVVATAILLILGGFIFSIFLYSRRHNRHVQEKENLAIQFQQTLLESQLEIQERTVNVVSQEIHDNIGQVLSLAKLNIGTIDICQPETAQ